VLDAKLHLVKQMHQLETVWLGPDTKVDVSCFAAPAGVGECNLQGRTYCMPRTCYVARMPLSPRLALTASSPTQIEQCALHEIRLQRDTRRYWLTFAKAWNVLCLTLSDSPGCEHRPACMPDDFEAILQYTSPDCAVAM
jgi:hypothetical protein